MSHIIAGRFEQQDRAHEAVDRLVEAGFSADQISAFYCNPPGQHAAYPIGGDHDKSVGAEDSDTGWASGASTGGMVGAALGVAGIPIAGPLGPALGALVGAHTGSLIGAMRSMKECPKEEDMPLERKSGLVVAVCSESEQAQRAALDVLRAVGADQLEQAEGTIQDGDWRDFDPTSTPVPIKANSELRPPPTGEQTF